MRRFERALFRQGARAVPLLMVQRENDESDQGGKSKRPSSGHMPPIGTLPDAKVAVLDKASDNALDHTHTFGDGISKGELFR
jgi:hypothetical protein